MNDPATAWSSYCFKLCRTPEELVGDPSVDAVRIPTSMESHSSERNDRDGECQESCLGRSTDAVYIYVYESHEPPRLEEVCRLKLKLIAGPERGTDGLPRAMPHAA